MHAQLNLDDESVDLIDLGEARSYKVRMRVVSLDGKTLSDDTQQVQATADDRTTVAKLDLTALSNGHTVFVVLDVADASGAEVSNNFYWWAANDATLRELDTLPEVHIKAAVTENSAAGEHEASVTLSNTGSVPAVMIKLTLKDAATGDRILPAYYSDNYISLLPGEQSTITVKFPSCVNKPGFALRGWNLDPETIAMH